MPFYDRTWLIDTTLTTVFKNLLEGALLVTLVLYSSWATAAPPAIVALMIPLSLLATFIGLRLRGIPANLLSLGAMDFGIIVDGAVIVVENMFRTLADAQRDATTPTRVGAAAILDATVEVGRPTLFSMLIIIAAHIPIFTLQRHEGRIFAPMAYTVIVGAGRLAAVLADAGAAAVLLPARQRRHARGERARRRSASASIAASLTWALAPAGRRDRARARGARSRSLALVPRLGTEFLPELNEGSIWVNVMLPPSVSVSRGASQMCARVRADRPAGSRKCTQVISQAGRPEDGTDPKPINMAEFFVDLKPPVRVDARRSPARSCRRRSRTPSTRFPGIEPSFSQPIRDNVLESISQIDGQIVIKMFGDDPAKLRQTGQRGAARRVADVPRRRRAPSSTAPARCRSCRSRSTARAPRATGSTSPTSRTSSRPRSAARSATEIWEGERQFGVVVRLRERDQRTSTGDRNILVDTPDGAARAAGGGRRPSGPRRQHEHQPRIGHAARGDRRVHSRPRHGQRRRRDADASRAGGEAARPATSRPGGGEFENQQRAMTRLEVIVPISVFLIFLLLFDAFGSVRNAALILLNIPFALIGGIVALLRHRHPPERVGGHRLHRAVRAGGAERRRDGQLLQRAAQRRDSRRATR